MYLKCYPVNKKDNFTLQQWLEEVCGVWHRKASHNVNTDIYQDLKLQEWKWKGYDEYDQPRLF